MTIQKFNAKEIVKVKDEKELNTRQYAYMVDSQIRLCGEEVKILKVKVMNSGLHYIYEIYNLPGIWWDESLFEKIINEQTFNNLLIGE